MHLPPFDKGCMKRVRIPNKCSTTKPGPPESCTSQDEIIPTCRELGIAIMAYSPLGESRARPLPVVGLYVILA